MKITVITPVYNGEKYIKDTIESVLNQRGEFELEYIVIDGGSSDNTLDITKIYYQKYEQGEYDSYRNSTEMFIYSEPDEGMYDALKKGFEYATGSVLCWINADDYFLDESLKKVNDIFSQNLNIKWISGRCNVVNSRRGYLNRSILRYYPSNLIINGGFGLYTPFFIPQESVFWRKELLNNVNLNDFVKYKLAGDFYLWYQFALQEKLYSVNEDFAVFRKTDNNLSANRKYYKREMQRIIDPQISYTFRDSIQIMGYEPVWKMNQALDDIKFPYINKNSTGSYEIVDKSMGKGLGKKISIITVCYNEPNIMYTCESIVNQTYSDYEWIVVDGGSNQEIQEVLNRYKERMNVFISEPDNGIYDAMNKGIEIARGEWLIFMNGGDQFYNVNVLKEIFGDKEYEADILYGNEERQDSYGKRYTYYLPERIPKFFMCYQSFAHQAMFYRKKVFDKYGKYDENYMISADSERNNKFLVENVKFEKIQKIISAHVLDGVSADNKYKEKMQAEKQRRLLKYYPANIVDLYSQGMKKSTISIKIPFMKVKSYKGGRVKKYYLFGLFLLFTAKRAY